MIRTQTTVVVGRVNALDAGLYNFACILHSTSIRINLLEPVFFFARRTEPGIVHAWTTTLATTERNFREGRKPSRK
jgi:hypothetical protein